MMTTKAFDAIVIGAGSVGLPTCIALAERGLSVLCLEALASPGQGSHKCAIGGIRATHSDPSKVAIGLASLEVFRTWEHKYGDDIAWRQGGYTYVAYDEATETLLRNMLPGQRAAGLNIDWVDGATMSELVPGIEAEHLRGGTYSPDDGSASPLKCSAAFARRARELGVVFQFHERVTGFARKGDTITSVTTNHGEYAAGWFVNAAGMYASEVASLAGVDVPVCCDSHEAGITEPVQRFFKPMVVDIRKEPGSANYYFYQNEEGQVIFCITPDPPIWGTDLRETSQFLPMVARRMVRLYPRLANLKVRRTWRGCYPNSIDGLPYIDRVGATNHLVAVGMSGQGFMFGPGVGELVARMVTAALTPQDRDVLHPLRVTRGQSIHEALA